MMCRGAARLVWALLLAWLLQGCALQPKNISSDFALSEASEAGVMIGSITYTGGYSGYSVFFKAKEGEQIFEVQTGAGITLLPVWPEGDFGDIGLKGDLFAIELPAGDYNFYSWGVSSGLAHINPTAPFTIRFVVKPGQAVYTGNFNFHQTARMGLTVTGVSVSYSDWLERDVGLFRARYDKVEIGRINRGIEEGLIQNALGGGGSTRFDPPVIFIPVF